MAIGAGWLSIWLFNRSSRIPTWAPDDATEVPRVGVSH